MQNTQPNHHVVILRKTPRPVNTSSLEFAKAWLAHRYHPGDRRKLNRFGELADAGLRQHIPDGSRGGALRGQEADIRQDAYLILNRYLLGNPQIEKAEQSGDLEEIENRIHRCIRIATSIASKRLARETAALYPDRNGEFSELDEAMVSHPCDVTDEIELAEHERRGLALAAVSRAVKTKALLPKDAEMIRDRIKSGLTQADYARQMGVSREAIHQREVRALKVLRRAVGKTEVPIK